MLDKTKLRILLRFVCLVGLLSCTGFVSAQGSGGKLIYCRNGVLYSVPITPEGQFQQGKTPHKIARLPAQTDLEDISVSADGSLLAISISNKDGQNTCLWTVADKAGAKLARLAGGSTPRFAPTGRLLAYTTPDNVVCVSDLTTGRQRVLRRGAYKPSWSADGGEIAFCFENDNGADCGVMVVDTVNGKRVRFQRDVINAAAALLSPDRRYIAYNPHLSRPKMSGIIEDRKSGRSFALPHQGSPVLDWSADSNRLLWTRYIIDPQNNGAFLWEEIWATATNGWQSKRIDIGRNARFAPDGKHILYIRTAAHEQAESMGVYIANSHSRKRLLENCDDAFAVWKPARRVDIANAR